MSEQYTRRGFLKRAFGYSIGAILTTAFGYTYSRYIEPHQLEINRYDVRSPYIPKGFKGIRILQFSDTHIGHYYDIDQFSELIHTINGLEADLVFFTGDLIDAPDRYPNPSQLIPLLSAIRAPLGKFSIYGNHDHGGYGTESYKQIMEQAGFTLLINSATNITFLNETITIAGLDDYMLGRPDFEQTLRQIPENEYTILLAHEPDVAKISHSYPVHLQLSGHSHGGQVQFPFYGAVITPPYASDYVEGFYEIGNIPLTLYVNRGLGTTRVPFRFLSKPEISIFTLKPGT
ncbi:metallophosphoesterase [Bacillus pinisoli]|uniref:metallophosphoesterase n=1 Tax=Bacillus pinisoli TaxID=2901866 RepID=UPI001FF35C4C|nr:metallophosphoesterase [Bacillus pinisoli]